MRRTAGLWRAAARPACDLLLDQQACFNRAASLERRVAALPDHSVPILSPQVDAIDIRRVQWQDRAHFFAMAARLMRRALVDFARAGKNQKRGGAMQRITFDQDLPVAGESPEDLIAIDEALAAFAKEYERKAQVVELWFFGGLSVEETAEVLNISPETGTGNSPRTG